MYCVQHLCTVMCTTGAVLGWQNTSSEQPPPNMAAANFILITNVSLMDASGELIAILRKSRHHRNNHIYDVNLVFLLAINGLAVAAATSMGKGCTLNGTAVATVLIAQ